MARSLFAQSMVRPNFWQNEAKFVNKIKIPVTKVERNVLGAGDRQRTHKDVSLNGRVLDLVITRYGRIVEYKAAQWPF
jgi:hypothetical protein